MKKQLMRYKLIADQKVGRANKSEVLNDELLEIEKHMEHVRSAYQSSYKKLQQCLHSQGHGENVDKRLKRIPENHLGNCLSECGLNLENSNELDEPLSKSLQIAGEVFSDLAKEEAMYEQFVEENIINPFHTLVETEIPGMLKVRERLKRLVLDRDNATQNLNKAVRTNPTGMNAQQARAKIDALQDEFDGASIRMEQCKDQLITEMFEFLSKETEHSQRMLDLHAKQLSYHRKCVEILERNEQKLMATQESARKRSAYKFPIEEHLAVTGREIASPIEACVLMILEFGLREEGILRISGSTSKQNKCRAILDAGKLDLAILNAQDDIHAVAGAMRCYLRELPDPLLTFELHSQWVKAGKITDNDAKLQEIWRLIEQLPPANKANLRYLVKFFSMVASNSDYNKMNSHNVALVVAPNILWNPKDDMSAQLRDQQLISGVMESMIVYADWFFPGEINFVVTPNATSYVGGGGYNNSDPVMPTTAVPPTTTPAPVSPRSSTQSSTQSLSTTATSHNRNSSAEGALAAAGFPIVTGDSTYGTSTVDRKMRKQKSKAPPPPAVNNGQLDMTSNRSRSKSMHVSTVTTSSGEPDRSAAHQHQQAPVATRRASTRRPQAPPPQPPTTESTTTTTTTTKPVKPPVAARRRPQVAGGGSTTSSSPDNMITEDRSSSTEPSYPPPPLPNDDSPPPEVNTNNSSSKISEIQKKLQKVAGGSHRGVDGGHIRMGSGDGGHIRMGSGDGGHIRMGSGDGGHIRMGSGDSSDGQMTQF